MDPDLSQRLAAALQHQCTLDEEAFVVTAASDPDVEFWEDLPQEVRDLVVVLEQRPLPNLDGVGEIPYPTAVGSEEGAPAMTVADAILAAQEA